MNSIPMAGGNNVEEKVQLDNAERDHLEDVVTDLREIVESEIEFILEHQFGLANREGGPDLSADEQAVHGRLVDAIEHENPGEKSWDWCYQQYVTGVGYTIINRLAGFRCMEVRGFLLSPVTQIGDSGLTPAAENLLGERLDIGREDSLIAAYHEACEEIGDEIDILFDPNSPYSVIDPTPDLFRDLIEELDRIPDGVWQADDVLGWIYEYYNRPVVERLADKNTLEPEEVAAANQFYTPHWVVRLLTDNSLGRLYLEKTGEVNAVAETQSRLSIDERKTRSPNFDESSNIADFCTYLLPDQESGEPTDFDHPEELRVLDPACGSGHFLLYAFDVLERIWRRECPELDPSEIPSKILEHNLYGVELDLRACQLATFNLYLKARDRAQAEGNSSFELPRMGIVSADARVANTEDIGMIFEEISGEHDELEDALQTILDSFENIEALGTLLDAKGTLEDVFDTGEQQTLLEAINGTGDLNSVLSNLRERVDERFDEDSFDAQELRSFLRLLVILTQDYDVALMNPPYGSGSRMPDPVQEYVENYWKYPTEYYINFFEICDELSKENGRVGMLVKREFMFKNSLSQFRQDFIGERGSFDFLAEFGEGVLDKAKVRNAATVVRTDAQESDELEGTFIRLHDIPKGEKEEKLLRSAYENSCNQSIQRVYKKELSEFDLIPGSHMSYWAPIELRKIFGSDVVFDAKNAGVERNSHGLVKQGLATADNDRFIRYLWEAESTAWVPYAKGGEDAWTLPRVNLEVLWGENGEEIKSTGNARTQNTQHYFSEALTYTYMKSSGRRFGYLHPSSIFGHAGNVFLPESSSWSVLGYGNSHMVTYLMACLDPGRHWEVGNVSKLPWYPGLSDVENLETETQKIAGHLLYQRMSDFDSPFYSTPELLRFVVEEDPLPPYESHPHRELIGETELPEFKDSLELSSSLYDLATKSTQINEVIGTRLDKFAHKIDTAVFDFFDLDDELRGEVLTEISIRTNEDPELNPEFEIKDISEPKNYETLTKDLVLHFALKAVLGSDDGIAPVEAQRESYESILEMVVSQFERVFGEYADERLKEVDDVLGHQQSADIAYPNLQQWLKEDLFEYHLDRFENTPILWRLTSRRVVSDEQREGFGCYVDYHRFDESTFDRIQSNYLEERKSDLNDLRSSANRRRDDDSLSDSERAKASELYNRYENARRQVDAFEERLLELTRSRDRDWNEEFQELAENLKQDIELLRDILAERMDAFEKLVDMSDDEWLGDTFTPTFPDYVLDEQETWFTALDCGIEAAEGYAREPDKPVPAHLYDYLGYCEDTIGTTTHHRNGLLFLNHYFGDKEFRALVEDGKPREGMDKCETMLARLAAGIDQDAEIGEKVKRQCEKLQSEVTITWDDGHSSDWEGRALDEIMTGGYEPVKKHGVAVNMRPLAVQEIVPERVVEDVLL